MQSRPQSSAVHTGPRRHLVSIAEQGGPSERHDLADHMTDDIGRGAPPTGDMDPEAYRWAARRVADWTANYLRDVERFPVLSPGQPGTVRRGLPAAPPVDGE